MFLPVSGATVNLEDSGPDGVSRFFRGRSEAHENQQFYFTRVSTRACFCLISSEFTGME